MRQLMLHIVPFFPSVAGIVLWTSNFIERRKAIVTLSMLEQLVQGLFLACLSIFFNLIWPWAFVGNRPRYAIYAGLFIIVVHTVVAAARAHQAGKVLPERRASSIASGFLVLLIVPCLFAILHVLLAPFPADQIAIAFPLQGKWSVGQGGASVLTNTHISYMGQRYALDLVKVGPDGKCFRDGQHLENYYSWRQPVCAPLSGMVIEAVETYADNQPGKLGGGDSRGNHVRIRSAAGEIVLLAHLRHQSVLVQRGDAVQEGQFLAEVGNSGNTTAPHLHIEASRSTGAANAVNVPMYFRDIGAGLRSQRRGCTLTGPLRTVPDPSPLP